MTAEFHRADVRRVLEILAKEAGVNLALSPEVRGAVSLRLADVPWFDAFDAIARTLHYEFTRDSSGVFHVRPTD